MVAYSIVVTGPLCENCYIVWNEGKAWIIDPGADAEEIIAEVEQRQLEPVAILLTHGHFDHLGALNELLKKWNGLPVVMRAEEAKWAFTHPMNQYPPFYSHQQRPRHLIAAEASYSNGGMTARLIATPGHTSGGQCILIAEQVERPLCFTGDTLFQGSIGRTDLPGGSFLQLNESLRMLTELLLPETTILPGHGEVTTMAEEFRCNPYLQRDIGF